MGRPHGTDLVGDGDGGEAVVDGGRGVRFGHEYEAPDVVAAGEDSEVNPVGREFESGSSITITPEPERGLLFDGAAAAELRSPARRGVGKGFEAAVGEIQEFDDLVLGDGQHDGWRPTGRCRFGDAMDPPYLVVGRRCAPTREASVRCDSTDDECRDEQEHGCLDVLARVDGHREVGLRVEEIE